MKTKLALALATIVGGSFVCATNIVAFEAEARATRRVITTQTSATRVRFGRRKRSTALASSITSGTDNEYLIAVRRGQRVTISVASPCKAHVLMTAHAPDGTKVASGTQFYSAKVTKTGDISLRVASTSPDSCRITLRVRNE